MEQRWAQEPPTLRMEGREKRKTLTSAGKYLPLFLLGLLCLLPEPVLAQCQGGCTTPQSPPPAPVVPSSYDVNGSYQVSVYNGMGSYGYTYWSTGHTTPANSTSYLGVAGASTGTHQYRAKRCYLNGVCSDWGPWSSSIYVVPAPDPAGFEAFAPNACGSSLTVNWAPGSGYYSGSASKRYDLELSTNGGAWSGWGTNHASDSKQLASTTEGVTYQFRVQAYFYLNGEYSPKSGWTTSSAYVMPECPPAQPAAPALSQPNPDTGTAVSLSWTAPPVAVGAILGYNVQRRNATLGTEWTTLGGACATSNTGCTDSEAHTRGEAYEYRIQAYKSTPEGGSAWSEVAGTTIAFAQPSAPPAPDFSSVAPFGYTVNWSGGGNGNTGAISYKLWEKIGAAPGVWTDVGAATSQNFTDREPATSYEYKIQACNGNATPQCVESAATTISFPGTPGAIAIGDIANAGRNYTLSWSAAAGSVTHYELMQSTDGGQNWTEVDDGDVAPLTESIINAAPGLSYQYKVRACNSLACGVYGAVFDYWVPEVPGGLSTNADPTAPSLTISWTANAQADHYAVEQSTDNVNWQTVADPTAPSLIINSGLANGTTYYFRVTSCNALDECSGYSGTLEAYLPYAAPGATGALSHNASENNPAAGAFTVHWTAPAAIDAAMAPITHYRIDYSANGGSTWQPAPTVGAEPGRIDVSNPSPNSSANATLSGLTTGAAYSVRARACNADACGGNTPSYQVYLPHPAPGAPGIMPTNPSPEDHAARRFTVQWATPSTGTVHHYQLEAYAGVINNLETWVSVAETPATSHTFIDRAYGQAYRYRLRACSEAGAGSCSAWAVTAEIRLKYPTPKTPGGIAVGELDPANGNYTLSWNGVLGWAPRYHYQLQQAPAGSNAWAAPTGATGEWLQLDQTGHPITGQLPGRYDYRVRACNPAPDSDCGPWSPGVEVTVLATPEPPAGIDVEAGACRFHVDWTPPPGTVEGEYRYELTYQMDSGDWQSLAWSSGASHDMIVGEDDDDADYTFRVRARTLSDGVYSAWSDWRTAAAVPAEFCADPFSGHAFLSAPRYNETGQYEVKMAAHYQGQYGYRAHRVSVNGGGWEPLTGAWSEEDGYEILTASYTAANAQPTGRYRYRFEHCYSNVVLHSACQDPGAVLSTAETGTTVLRDPGGVGPLTPGGSVTLVNGVYRLADRNFTLNWSAAPNPGLASLHYEVQYREADADPLLPGTTGPWMILSQQTAVGLSGSVPESGIPYEYRVRACVSFADYLNCGAWADPGAPLIQSVGKPRFAVSAYPVDGELVIYDKRVPLQWLPPLGMAAAGALDHYQISLLSEEVGAEGETFWVGPETLTTVAPGTNASGEPLLQQASVEVEQGGRKEFWIRACGSESPQSCGEALIFEITVIVPPEPPAEPAGLAGQAHPDPGGDPFNGALSGEFSVQPSGAAGYTLPIIVPPGTNGMQPGLSLSYSSQAGNGIAGQGWSIGGISAISRCNKTLAQDGEIHAVDYSNDDALCLDGQRLIHIGGDQYRTEINNFSRITSISGGVCGTWFQVETQDGRRLEYGNTEDACINAVKANGQTVVSAWALNKVIDLSGNYMVYKYLEDTAANGNAHAIDRIEYTGHETSGALPYTALQFQYDAARPDAGSGYQAGVKFTRTRRLTAIVTGVTAANPSGYGTYTLTYQPPVTAWESGRLQSIEYCATVAGTEQCMAPLSFEWSAPEAGWAALPAAYAPPLPFVDGSDDRAARLLDLNNDGLPELLYASQNHDRVAYRNTGSGWTLWSAFTPPVDFVNSESEDLGVRFADIDGDNLPELLTSIDRGDGTYRVYRNTGGGWQESASMALPASFTRYEVMFQLQLPATDNGLRLADLNGDGLVDLVHGGPDGTYQAWRNTGSSGPRWDLWASYNPPVALAVKRPDITAWPIDPPTNFEDKAYDTTGWLADFNGDGLPDLFTKDTPHDHVGGTFERVYYRVRINDGGGWSMATNFLISAEFDYFQFPDAGTLLADFNGDGLPDLMRGNTQNDLIKLNTGGGWAEAPFDETPRLLFLVNGDRLSPAGTGVQLADVNADGRTDVLADRGAWLATETGWDEDHRYAMPVAPDEGLLNGERALALARGVQLADVNGDGRLDLLHAVASKKSAWTTRADRRQLIAITDGLGNTTGIRYQALTDPRLDGRSRPIHTPAENPPAYPYERAAHAPMQVVSQVIVNDGIGGELLTEYAYQGLTSHVQRGLQGFESMTAYKPGGTVATTRYARRFPYTGLPLEVSVTYGEGAGAELLERTNHEYCYALTSAAGSTADPETLNFTSADGTCGAYDDRLQNNESAFVFTKRTTAVKNLLDDSLGSVAATITTVTDNTYGPFGHLAHSLATTTGDGHAYATDVSNVYDPQWRWLGRVQETTVTRSIDGATDDNSIRKTQYSYNSIGLLEREVSEPQAAAPIERSTAYAYDEYGNRIETTACEGSVCEARPDSANSDSPGRSATTLYDIQGRYPVTLINALDQTETREYAHPLGLQTKLTGPNGLITSWEYDPLGRKLAETTPFGTTTLAYRAANESGYVPGAKYSVQTAPPEGAPTRTYYDGKGRQRRTLGQSLHGEYIAADIEYDRFGRVRRESQPYFVYAATAGDAHWTVHHYDDLDRITHIEVPIGDIDSDGADDGLAVTSSDHQGFSTITVDAKNRRALKEQNALGRTVRSVDDLDDQNIAVEYDYDSQGNLVSTIVDGNPATAIALAYDTRGNKISMTDPDMGHWEYQYNGFGELIWQRDAKGQVTEIEYDKLGRMTERVDDAAGTPQTSTWVYDTAPGAGIGKLHTETGAEGDTKVYAYTDRGQLEETVYGIDTHGFAQSFSILRQYDAFGRLQLIHYPQVGGERPVVENRYSPFGGLWYVLDVGDPMDSGDDSVYWIAEMVDARGKLLQETLRNQNIVSNSTNAATGWLQKVESWDKDLNMIQQTRYAFDKVGNIQVRERFRPWIVHPDGSFQAGENEQLAESFAYDSLDRLLSSTVTRDGQLPVSKVNNYDRLGNVVYKDDPDHTHESMGSDSIDFSHLLK